MIAKHPYSIVIACLLYNFWKWVFGYNFEDVNWLIICTIVKKALTHNFCGRLAWSQIVSTISTIALCLSLTTPFCSWFPKIEI